LDIFLPRSSSGKRGNGLKAFTDAIGRNWSSKQAARIAQDRFHEAGQTSRYRQQLDDASGRGRRREEKELYERRWRGNTRKRFTLH